ncbi:twin-arginine translocation signal domain-containing protein [Halorubrum ezzemoulense]|uniref:twin-arginine translocation signal domain-containing protein n=1 Tax=Halorubrum ezzemoulense TaxID=337243 RepID=UPI00232CCAE1|nr:twin-arginine translocation signal domain-containing protein [Halorubrum ezzemoulense]MDB2243028.1 twin-arginine translocation signal domain-containing protein [Halorubrum ezzemoulense]
MEKSDTDGLQTSVTTAESDKKNQQVKRKLARRQFLGAAAVAVGVAALSGNTEADEPESFRGTVEWKASGVWNDHLLPARNALISSEGVDVVEAKEELREALQKLEAIEVGDDQ